MLVVLPSDLIAGVEHVTGVGYPAIRMGGRDKRVNAARVLASQLLKQAGMSMLAIDDLLGSHPAGDVDPEQMEQAYAYAEQSAKARRDRWTMPGYDDMVPAWYIAECLHAYENLPPFRRPPTERYAQQWLAKQKHLG